MYVQHLDLLSFRNYEKLAFGPSSGLNVLFGANAQGKSAVLEAVYLLATSKSHRTSRDLDMIRVGDENSRVCAQAIRNTSTDVMLEIVLSRGEKKTVKINGVRHHRIADMIGQIKAVVFSALDIEMIRGEPDLRRRFMNLEISQVSPGYVMALSRYKRALEQRNSLLKSLKMEQGSISGLEVWDSQVAEYGSAIAFRRQEFLGALSTIASEIYRFLTDSTEELCVGYKPNLCTENSASEQEIREVFLRRLSERRQVDMARGTTTVGPHRDDMDFTVSRLSARDYGSQGQQRTAALAVKLAEIELIEQSTQESPVVLLDDAGAELDELRRTRVVEKVACKCQTIITTARPEELGSKLLESASMFQVRAGTVTPA